MLRNVMTKTAWAGALLGVLSVTGCYGTFHEIVDPCYPERYNCKAREAVHNLTATQIQNGLMYEQTMFVHHFNPSESSLNAGGVAHLQRLANRRPAPEEAKKFADYLNANNSPADAVWVLLTCAEFRFNH
mgnify:CR=1 FL=1